MYYAKGHKFYGPDCQGYELSEDWDTNTGYPPSSKFKEFGGAERPLTGMAMPQWLVTQIQRDTHSIK